MTTTQIRRAFTLIEVLIGVLVLALGVLGLGAIIPVVVREQRLAADATLGVASANAAKGDLLSLPGFDPRSEGLTVWDAFIDNATNANSRWSRDGQWADWSSGSSRTLRTWFSTGLNTRLNVTWDFGFDPDQGEMFWDATTIQPQTFDPATGNWTNTGSSLPARYYTLPAATRLWPNTSGQPVETLTGGVDPYRPQFVWDIVGRRLPAGADEPAKLQIALFVRRVDLNVRLRTGVSLWDVLTDWTGARGTTDADRCVPVAMDRATTTSGGLTSACGLPTNRGNNGPGVREYAQPIFLGATFDPAKPDEIQLDLPGTNDNRWRLAAQPGQKLVDNLGNVYTVLGEGEDGTSGLLSVKVDPPIPGWVPDPSGPNPPGLPGLNPAKLNQVVFTPQIPAAVTLFTISRPLN